eukprot:4257279-Prymnesium_polylepis.1
MRRRWHGGGGGAAGGGAENSGGGTGVVVRRLGRARWEFSPRVGALCVRGPLTPGRCAVRAGTAHP